MEAEAEVTMAEKEAAKEQDVGEGRSKNRRERVTSFLD
jgi:hypothetical protein